MTVSSLAGKTLIALNNLGGSFPPSADFKLGDYLNEIVAALGGGGSEPTGEATIASVALDGAGVLLSAVVAEAGVYRVDFCVTVDVSGVDGGTIEIDSEPSQTLGWQECYLAVVKTADGQGAAAMYSFDTGDTNVGSMIVSGGFKISGFVTITDPGSWAYRIRKQGTITGLLKAGSGISLTKIST